MTKVFECDCCKKTNEFPAITVSCGYGSRHDEDIFHFCGEQCMAKFYKNDAEKEVKK